ncbi:helix-turn-helix domain-containing protein [Sphingomonas aurantiaca]
MSDRLTTIGRMGASERLSTLLLDIMARLRVTAGGIVDSFDLPLTQTDIGDALGLTKVHVNRTIRALEKSGVIERTGRRVRIVDEAALVAATGFTDRYGEIETAWLPPAI